MEKPFNLKVLDTKNDIVEIINEAKLPICMVTSILKEILNDVLLTEQQIIDNERIEYEKNN